MLALILFGGFVLSLETAIRLTPRLKTLAIQRGWIDAPDGQRKIHAAPIPNIGGLAIVAATLVGIGGFTLAAPWLPAGMAVLAPHPLIVLGACAIALVGFLDDLYDLNFRIKLAAQIAVALLVVASGFRIDVMGRILDNEPLELIIAIGLTVFWMVGTMNAVNFIDGMDGLAGGAVAIALAGLTGVHLVHGHVEGMILFVALMGAVLGFLRYNFHPATIFMGDSGSLFLGYLLAAYALMGSAHRDPVLQFMIPVVAMGLPILDTGLSITRRLLRGQSLFYPDRDHIHHRLAALTTHRRAVILLYALSAFFAVGAVGMSALHAPAAFALFGLGTVLVALFLQQLGYLPWGPFYHSDSPESKGSRYGKRSAFRMDEPPEHHAPGAPVGGDGAGVKTTWPSPPGA